MAPPSKHGLCWTPIPQAHSCPNVLCNLLLGADISSDILLYDQRCGPVNTLTAFKTQFGWVLTGKTSAHSANYLSVAYHNITVASGDDNPIDSLPKQLKNERSHSTSYQVSLLLHLGSKTTPLSLASNA